MITNYHHPTTKYASFTMSGYDHLFHHGRSSMIILQVSIVHDHHSLGDAAVSDAEVVPILNDIQEDCDDNCAVDHDDIVDKAVDKLIRNDTLDENYDHKIWSEKTNLDVKRLFDKTDENYDHKTMSEKTNLDVHNDHKTRSEKTNLDVNRTFECRPAPIPISILLQ